MLFRVFPCISGEIVANVPLKEMMCTKFELRNLVVKQDAHHNVQNFFCPSIKHFYYD